MTGVRTAWLSAGICLLCHGIAWAAAMTPQVDDPAPSGQVFDTTAFASADVDVVHDADVGLSLALAIQKGAPHNPGSPRDGERWREQEDAYFVNKARNLAERIRQLPAFRGALLLGAVKNGEEFLEALASASRYGRIANLVIYGHASSTALYMLDDRGFYVSVAAVAKNSRLATGTDAERTSKLKNLGAREVIDLATLVHDGAIRFVDNAVIFLAGCETAGSTNMAPRGIAAQIAANSGATTIGSIGPTDQSMTERRGGFSANEYSRGTWVRFVKGGGSERLRTRILNALQQLHLEATSLPVAPAPPPAPPSVGAQFHPFRCAAQRPVGGEALLTSCGVDVYGEPIVQLHKGETRA
jgi:hypothetical protein